MSVDFDHADPTITISFETNLNQPAADESWGISDYTFSVFPCNPLCSQCKGPEVTACSACSDQAFMLTQSGTSSCVTKCPILGGLYANFNTHTCDKCNTSCANCNGPADFNCLNCDEGKFLYNNRCVSSCPNNMFPNSLTKSCSTDCPNGTFPNKEAGQC